MNELINKARTAMRKRAMYRRTVAELQSLPPDVARELNIYPGMASELARQAVYGR